MWQVLFAACRNVVYAECVGARNHSIYTVSHTNAGAYVPLFACFELVDVVGIGNKCPSHANHIDQTLTDRVDSGGGIGDPRGMKDRYV